MTDDSGANESRTLKGGEIIYLLRKPDRKWNIRRYECHQRIKYDLVGGGLIFEFKQGLPQEWRELEFETADDAVAFMQEQIDNGKAPANSMAVG